MPGKHDVYVLNVGGEYRVRPAVAALQPNEKLKIRNLTDKPVVLVFPPGLLAITEMVETVPATDRKEFNLHATVKGGDYSYSVFTVVNGKPVFATGDSDPILIIDV